MSRRWPGPFRHDHAGRAGAQQRLRGAGDQRRMRVDDALGRVLDHVRLEQDALAAHVHLQQRQAATDDVGEVEVVARGRQQRDGRRRRDARSAPDRTDAGRDGTPRRRPARRQAAPSAGRDGIAAVPELKFRPTYGRPYRISPWSDTERLVATRRSGLGVQREAVTCRLPRNADRVHCSSSASATSAAGRAEQPQRDRASSPSARPERSSVGGRRDDRRLRRTGSAPAWSRKRHQRQGGWRHMWLELTAKHVGVAVVPATDLADAIDQQALALPRSAPAAPRATRDAVSTRSRPAPWARPS